MISSADLSIELCLPNEEHARVVMEWRNDPHTLMMFYHHDPKSWTSFWKEFQSEYFRHPNCLPFFVLFKSERVGFIRITPIEHPFGLSRSCCEISININPAKRGNGLGKKALKLAEAHLKNLGIDDVYAEVRVENLSSVACFKFAGYRLMEEKIKKITDTNENCKIFTFIRNISSTFLSNRNVFIIAEAGSNWRMGDDVRDEAMAKALIDVAVEAGSDAVKFQTYRPENVYVENAGASDYLSNAGIKTDVVNIFRDLSMRYELIEILADYCKKSGIQFMSTPFGVNDFNAIDPFVSIHKIASYELSHPHLLKKAAHSGKPLVLSTGACNYSDILWAVNFFRENGGQELCLMQCTAKYPTPIKDLNLRAIPWLKNRFNVIAGFSDHSRDPLVGPISAVAMGAQVIEKHFTLSNKLPGPDHSFALTPAELKIMVDGIRKSEGALGSGIKKISQIEKELASFARRGIQAIKDIKKGDQLIENINISILRPGKNKLGIHPKYIDVIEGKRAIKEIKLGCGLSHGDWDEQ